MKKHDLRLGCSYCNKNGTRIRTIVKLDKYNVVYVQHGRLTIAQQDSVVMVEPYRSCYMTITSAFAKWAYKEVERPKDSWSELIQRLCDRDFVN